MPHIVSTGTFDMVRLFAGYQISSSGLETSTTTRLEWALLDPQDFEPPVEIVLTGSGFALDGDGAPIAGQVTGLEIKLNASMYSDAPMLTVRDILAPLQTAVENAEAGALKALALFETVLGGRDSFSLGDGSRAWGDRWDVSGGNHVFVRDIMELTGKDGTLWGDVRLLDGGAQMWGGHDVLSATGTMSLGVRLYGDAQAVDSAVLRGGNDWFGVRSEAAEGGTSATALIVGDASEVIGTAHVTGGDDRMFGSLTLGDRMFGDAEFMQSGNPTLVGGDDVLIARGGNDFLYGDVDQISAGVFVGGNDTLNGGGGNDLMWGDYARGANGTTRTGGDDALYGMNGHDGLLGQGGNDTLFGGWGNDTLLGEDGSDKLFGGPGNDLISGGAGGDTMLGADGADTFIWQAASELGGAGARDVIWLFESGVDVIHLSAVARELGGLTWVGDGYAGVRGTIGYTDLGTRLKLEANADAAADPELVIFVGGTDVLLAQDVLL